jgi:hypothetical protein
MGHRDESLSFRFFSLSPTELEALREFHTNVESRRARGREGRVTAVFELREGEDYGWLKDFAKRHNIAATEYGLFVSISTSSDSEIVRVPQFAIDLIREVGGIIDFSFTVLSND